MAQLLRVLRPILLAGVVFIGCTLPSKAQVWDKVTKLVARYANGNPASIDNMSYGCSVSISGNYAVVGAVGDQFDEQGGNQMSSAGSAWVVFNDGGVWKPVKKLVAPVRNMGRFGCSVSISGDIIVVGESDERLEGTSKGSAYIFRKDEGGTGNWGFVKRLQTRARSTYDSFGLTVDISGSYVVVTSRFDNLDSGDGNYVEDAGAAFIFMRNLGGVENWGLVKKITAPARTRYDQFGLSAAIDGEQLIVSANGVEEAVPGGGTLVSAGMAYLFRKNQGGTDNWGLVKKITTPVRASGDYFGVSVDISGDNVIVGATGEDEDANEQNAYNDAGAAYIFSKTTGGSNNWGLVKKLTSNVRGYDAWYGESVAISNDNAVVGGRRETMDANQENYMFEAGATYIYSKNTGGTNFWGQSAKLFPPIRVPNEDFGNWVAMENKNLFVSSLGVAREPGDQSTVSFPGAVFVYKQHDALPVTLANFQVSKFENQALLEWTTSSETNTSYFEIQKSLNARDWTSMAIREAAKESRSPLHYTAWDYHLGAGNSYYRLKMVDLDGTFAYSSIRSLLSQSAEELIAFPNPVSDRIFIKAVDFSKILSVRIFTQAGKMVYESAGIDGEGISAGDLADGVYHVQIRNADGSVATKKIAVGK